MELKIEVVKDLLTLSVVNTADGKEIIMIKQKAVN